MDECFRGFDGISGKAIYWKGKLSTDSLALFDARFEFFSYFLVPQNFLRGSHYAAHLESAVRQRKSGFDEFNISILNRILEPLKLRGGVSRETVVDIFLQFQDYINAKYQTSGEREIDFKTHEEDCRRALDVLLHGVVERKDVDI